MRFVKSLKYALRGIVYCINNERNMRIHTVAVLYVLAFFTLLLKCHARVMPFYWSHSLLS